MGATEHHAKCSSQSGTGWCDCRGLPITLAALESGLPLTTGEGNTPGRIVVEGDVHKVEPTRQYFAELRASLKNALDVQHDVEAECGRLREQLDAREHGFAKLVVLAHERGDEFWQNELQIVGDFTLAEARAALGVEGPQPDQGSAPTENVGRARDEEPS